MIIKFKIKFNIIFFLLISGFLITCATNNLPKEYIYKFKNRFVIKSGNLNISSEKIDNSLTYQLFFLIKKYEKSIKISFICKNNQLNQKFPFIKTYFITEKIINSSQYKNSPRYIYSEIARNFNNNWETDNKITIKSDITDPIRKLTPGLYRIRFTVFENKKFSCDYTLTISSDSQISIFKNLPDEQLK